MIAQMRDPNNQESSHHKQNNPSTTKSEYKQQQYKVDQINPESCTQINTFVSYTITYNVFLYGVHEFNFFIRIMLYTANKTIMTKYRKNVIGQLKPPPF